MTASIYSRLSKGGKSPVVELRILSFPWVGTLSDKDFHHFVYNLTFIPEPASGHNEFLCPITMEIMKDPVIAAGKDMWNFLFPIL